MITQMKNNFYCKKCKKKTKHLKCGFGNVGGLLGNARYRCLNCGWENGEV